MKASELNELVQTGAILCVGNYLGGKADAISVRDKTTGARRSMAVARETVITGDQAVAVSTWLPDGADPLLWKPTLKRNQKCVVRITGMETQNGQVVLRGSIEALD